MADGGPGEADRHPWGTERGAETSGKTGQRQHGKQDHEQGSKSDEILNSPAGRPGNQRLHGVFHHDLHGCCQIVLITGIDCKELFKNIREQTAIRGEQSRYPTDISLIARS